jgi:hypothetical protein
MLRRVQLVSHEVIPINGQTLKDYFKGYSNSPAADRVLFLPSIFVEML